MEYLSTKQAAEIWVISQDTVARLCKEGRINGAIKVGGKWRIPTGTTKPDISSKIKKRLSFKKLAALLAGVASLALISTFVINNFMEGSPLPVSIETSTIEPYKEDGMRVVHPTSMPTEIDELVQPLPTATAKQTHNSFEGTNSDGDSSFGTIVTTDAQDLEVDEPQIDDVVNPPDPIASPEYDTLTRSNLHPYYGAGTYETETNMPQIINDGISCDKAFSVLNFIKNPKASDVRITENYFEVHNIQKIETPVLRFLPVVEDRAFVVYIVNDGWGDANECTISADFNPINPENYDFSKLMTQKDALTSFAIASGSRLKVLHYDINMSELISMANDSISLNVAVTFAIILGESMQKITCYGTLSRAGLSLYWGEGGGDGGDDYSIEFAVPLTVDELQAGSKVIFDGRKYTPVVSDSLRIETTFVPDKSCIITFQIVYVVNGTTLRTPEYSANVTVPFYSDWKSGVIYDNVAFSKQIQEVYDAD